MKWSGCCHGGGWCGQGTERNNQWDDEAWIYLFSSCCFLLLDQGKEQTTPRLQTIKTDCQMKGTRCVSLFFLPFSKFWINRQKHRRPLIHRTDKHGVNSTFDRLLGSTTSAGWVKTRGPRPSHGQVQDDVSFCHVIKTHARAEHQLLPRNSERRAPDAHQRWAVWTCGFNPCCRRRCPGCVPARPVHRPRCSSWGSKLSVLSPRGRQRDAPPRSLFRAMRRIPDGASSVPCR